MFQLTNDTPLVAERSIQLDSKGVQHWVVVVKGTYRFDGRIPTLVKEQEPVCVAAKYLGEEGRSSLLREAEMTYAHPGTDVIVNGVAHAPDGRPVRQMDVQVSVGSLTKTLRIFGDRQWVAAGPDLLASPPVGFTSMPITYERAFGGTVGEAFEERNPIGLGFGLSREHLIDRPLPNVEDPTSLIQSHTHRPPPAGLGAVPAHWMPRRRLAGTYDDAWRQQKLPLLPDDFVPQFFVAAPSGLHSPDALRGGERIRLQGLSPGGLIEFPVPREVVTVTTTVGRAKIPRAAQLARVIIEPETKQVVAVWHMSLRLGTRFREVKGSLVDFKPRVPR